MEKNEAEWKKLRRNRKIDEEGKKLKSNEKK